MKPYQRILRFFSLVRFFRDLSIKEYVVEGGFGTVEIYCEERRSRAQVLGRIRGATWQSTRQIQGYQLVNLWRTRHCEERRGTTQRHDTQGRDTGTVLLC